MQRFLDPAVLAGIASLDLVAKTVVDGFVAGLHRSPDFGFSQEFAEYRAYVPGDDLRHVAQCRIVLPGPATICELARIPSQTARRSGRRGCGA